MSGRSPHGKRRTFFWGGDAENMWKPCVWQVCVNLTKAKAQQGCGPSQMGKGKFGKVGGKQDSRESVSYQSLKEVPPHPLRQRKHLAFHKSDYSNIHFQRNLLGLPGA